MNRHQFQSAVELMAANEGLRPVKHRVAVGKRWAGVVSGIAVFVHLDAVRLKIELLSPEQPASESTETGSDGEAKDNDVETESNEEPFQNARAFGLQADWFQQFDPGYPWGFQLIVNQPRWKTLPHTSLNGLLKAIASDLHQLGAESVMPCSNCGDPANTVGMFEDQSLDFSYTPYCSDCWQSLDEFRKSPLRVNAPVNLSRGWLALAIFSPIFAILWGLLQHPAFGTPFPFLLAACLIGGIFLAKGVEYMAQGSNLALRSGLFISVALATLLGNIIGIKLLVADAVSWLDLTPFYFTVYFPAHPLQELAFLSCGLLGVVVAIFLLRESELIRFR